MNQEKTKQMTECEGGGGEDKETKQYIKYI